MLVGVPTEIKEDEYRVALTPAGARAIGFSGVAPVSLAVLGKS